MQFRTVCRQIIFSTLALAVLSTRVHGKEEEVLGKDSPSLFDVSDQEGQQTLYPPPAKLESRSNIRDFFISTIHAGRDFFTNLSSRYNRDNSTSNTTAALSVQKQPEISADAREAVGGKNDDVQPENPRTLTQRNTLRNMQQQNLQLPSTTVSAEPQLLNTNHQNKNSAQIEEDAKENQQPNSKEDEEEEVVEEEEDGESGETVGPAESLQKNNKTEKKNEEATDDEKPPKPLSKVNDKNSQPPSAAIQPTKLRRRNLTPTSASLLPTTNVDVQNDALGQQPNAEIMMMGTEQHQQQPGSEQMQTSSVTETLTVTLLSLSTITLQATTATLFVPQRQTIMHTTTTTIMQQQLDYNGNAPPPPQPQQQQPERKTGGWGVLNYLQLPESPKPPAAQEPQRQQQGQTNLSKLNPLADSFMPVPPPPQEPPKQASHGTMSEQQQQQVPNELSISLGTPPSPSANKNDNNNAAAQQQQAMNPFGFPPIPPTVAQPPPPPPSNRPDSGPTSDHHMNRQKQQVPAVEQPSRSTTTVEIRSSDKKQSGENSQPSVLSVEIPSAMTPPRPKSTAGDLNSFMDMEQKPPSNSNNNNNNANDALNALGGLPPPASPPPKDSHQNEPPANGNNKNDAVSLDPLSPVGGFGKFKAVETAEPSTPVVHGAVKEVRGNNEDSQNFDPLSLGGSLPDKKRGNEMKGSGGSLNMAAMDPLGLNSLQGPSSSARQNNQNVDPFNLNPLGGGAPSGGGERNRGGAGSSPDLPFMPSSPNNNRQQSQTTITLMDPLMASMGGGGGGGGGGNSGARQGSPSSSLDFLNVMGGGPPSPQPGANSGPSPRGSGGATGQQPFNPFNIRKRRAVVSDQPHGKAQGVLRFKPPTGAQIANRLLTRKNLVLSPKTRSVLDLITFDPLDVL